MKNLTISIPLTLILTACGGGGGSSSGNSAGQPQTPAADNSPIWLHNQNSNTCVEQEALNQDHQDALNNAGFALGRCSTDSFLGMCTYNAFINSSETLSARTIYYPGYLNSQELDDQLTVQLENSCNFLNGSFTPGNAGSVPSTGGENFVPVTTISSNNFQNFFLKEGYAEIQYSFEGQASGNFYPSSYSVRSLSNDSVTLNDQAHALFEITNDSGVRTIESINLATGAISQITQNSWSSNECVELVQGVIAVWTPLDQISSCSTSQLDTTKPQYLVSISDTDTDQPRVTSHAFALLNTFGLDIIKSDDNIYGVFARGNAGNYLKNNYYALNSDQGVQAVEK